MVISKEEFQSFEDHVGKAFIAMQTKMRALLQSANYGDLRRACLAQIHSPGGVKLPDNVVEKVSSTQNIDDLFDVLVKTSYWCWIDIRILEMMVVASGNAQAHELLSNYKAVIFSKRLVDMLPNIPSKTEKEEYYTIIVTKVEKDIDEMTVADLLKFQSQLEKVIMGIKEGVCVLDHLEKGCIEVHWYIPNSCIDRAYQNAKAKSSQFSDLHLQYIRIGDYPVISGSLEQTNGSSVSSPSVNAGKYRFTF